MLVSPKSAGCNLKILIAISARSANNVGCNCYHVPGIDDQGRQKPAVEVNDITRIQILMLPIGYNRLPGDDIYISRGFHSSII